MFYRPSSRNSNERDIGIIGLLLNVWHSLLRSSYRRWIELIRIFVRIASWLRRFFTISICRLYVNRLNEAIVNWSVFACFYVNEIEHNNRLCYFAKLYSNHYLNLFECHSPTAAFSFYQEEVFVLIVDNPVADKPLLSTKLCCLNAMFLLLNVGL